MRSRPLSRRAKVSVVVPCYNYGRYLPQCIESVMDNPGLDLEVIIVDDCSSDDSLEIAQRLSRTDPRVRTITHSVNRGHIATYNDGLSEVTGDYVVLLSADDLLTSRALERAVALFENHQELGLVYGYPGYFHGQIGEPRLGIVTWTTWTGIEWMRLLAGRGRNIIVSPEAVVRREVLESIGGYDAQHPHAADLKFWLQAARIGGVGRVNGAQQAWYRIHDSNMHTTVFSGHLTDHRHVKEVFDDVLADLGSVHELAMHRLAVEALRLPLSEEPARRVQEGRLALQLAREAAPKIYGTRLWRSYERNIFGSSGSVRHRMSGASHSLRWRVRYWRWRALGV